MKTVSRIALAALIAVLTVSVHADNLGDFAPGTTAICGQFTTWNSSTFAPATLAGTPALSVYKIGDGTNSTTESTTGVTHAEDVDSRTGLNRVCVDTSADGTFYSAGAQFSIIITTGTVNSVSVVGTEVKNFSLNKVAALRPTTAARTLDVSTGGEAGVDWANIGSPTTTVNLSGTSTKALEPTTAGRTLDVTSTGEAGLDFANAAIPTGVIGALGVANSGTMQSGSAAGTAVLASAASSSDNFYNNNLIFIYSGTGAGQGRNCVAYTGSTRTCTVGPTNWTTTPDNTSVYLTYGTAGAAFGTDSITAATLASDAGTELATANWAAATRRLTDATNIVSSGTSIPITSSRVDVSVGAYQSGLAPLQPTVAGRTLDVTTTGEAGIDWANIGSPTTTVAFTGTTVGTATTLTNAPSDSSGTTTLLSRLTATRAGYLDGLSAGVPTVAAIADGVWDEATTGHTTSGTFGEQLKLDVDAALAAVDTEIAAIKAKTDSLTFTVAGQVDANAESMNGVTILGNGTTVSPWNGE